MGEALTRLLAAMRGRQLEIERAAALLLVGWTMVRTWWLIEYSWVHTDDQAYTALRYARHLVDGHGLAWNPGGPPVEGYANFSYVLLAAGFTVGGFDPIIGLKLTGAVSLLVSVALTYVIARRWVRPVLAALPGTILTGHFGTVWWAASGLETALTGALVLATIALALRGFDRHRIDEGAPANTGVRPAWFVASALCAAVLGLTRPEAPVVAIAVAAAILVRGIWAMSLAPVDERRAVSRVHMRAFAAFVVPFMLVWGSYFVGRFVIFGRAYPQPVYCKRSYQAEPYEMHWLYWKHVAMFSVLALCVPIRRREIGVVLLMGPPLLYVWAMAYVHPFNVTNDRYFVPIHGLVVVAAVVALPHVLEFTMGEHARRWRDWALVAVVFAHYGTLDTPFKERTEERLERQEVRHAIREDLGLWLDARTAPGESVVIGDVGLVGYLARGNIIDAFCMNSPEMTEFPVGRSVQRWSTAIFRHKPERVVIHNRSDKRLLPKDDLGVYLWIAADPAFRRWYEREKIFLGGSARYFVYRRKANAPKSRSAAPPKPAASGGFIGSLDNAPSRGSD